MFTPGSGKLQALLVTFSQNVGLQESIVSQFTVLGLIGAGPTAGDGEGEGEGPGDGDGEGGNAASAKAKAATAITLFIDSKKTTRVSIPFATTSAGTMA